MRRLLLCSLLLLGLAGCVGNSTGHLCIGRGGETDYRYECDGDWAGMNDTQTISLESLSDSLGNEVLVEMTISTNAGSLNVSILSDDEPLTAVVNPGEPLTLGGVLFIAETRTITIVVEPLAARPRSGDRANGVSWQLLITRES